MSPDIAHTASVVMLFYVLVGLLFGLLFVSRLIDRVDPAAAGGAWQVRLLLLPGSVLLWPLLIWRVVRYPSDIPGERTPHKNRAAAARSQAQ